MRGRLIGSLRIPAGGSSCVGRRRKHAGCAH
jgi:hypothetical protein